MNKLVGFALCFFCLVLSRADENNSSYQCDKVLVYDASVKGELTSPFFYQRQKYHDGLKCEYRISAPEGHRIKVSFKEFDIVPSYDCNQDRLTVYGRDKRNPLGVLCGTEIPRPLISEPGENEMGLSFSTDFMGAGKGFVIQYESGRNLELCKSGFAQCNNRNCYDIKKKCDGEDDCGDGTDEENCGFPLIVVPEKCGTPVFQPKTKFGSPDRIVGGETAVPNSWPWQVSVRYAAKKYTHFCGGTLINAQWVLTATHCVVGKSPGDVSIHVGAHGKFNKTKYEQIRTAVKIIAYPDLEGEKISGYNKNHDISLIKLNAPVQFNGGAQPACIPNQNWRLSIGSICYATGWGESRGSGGSDVLKQTEQIVQSKETCNVDLQTKICVEKPNSSACHGDSGGPLQCKVQGKWFVFGAASYVTSSNFMGGLCTGPGARTVYANVADKVVWMRNIINKYS